MNDEVGHRFNRTNETSLNQTNTTMRISHHLLIAALAWVTCLVPHASARPATEKPNIVIIFVDDSGYGDYTHNGNPTISTPHISRLSEEGAKLTQFYVGTSACSASRYALLTGRYAGRSGLGRWVIGPNFPRYLHPKEVTLAEALKAQGYATAIFGKWHLGTPNKQNHFTADALPLAHGFDTWIGTNVSHDYRNAMLIQSDPNGTKPTKGYSIIAKNLPSNTKVSESLVGRYTKAAVSFIQKHKDQPFFLYLPHNQPHLALFRSDKFKNVSRRGMLGDVMAEVDDSVGQVMEAIKKAGISKNTIVIYASDNGPWLSHNKPATQHVGYAYPFRDGKGSTWEGGFRVPGIFYWPGQIKPHSVIQDPASTLDIFPTLMHLTGGKIPTDRTLDGRDISPLLLGNNKPLAPFKFIYSYSDNMPSGLRMGPWKLMTRLGSQLGKNYGFKASMQKPLLFQVEKDLGETYDEAKNHPDRVNAMRQTLQKMTQQIKTEGNFWGLPYK